MTTRTPGGSTSGALRSCAGPGIPGAGTRTATIGIVVSVSLAVGGAVFGGAVFGAGVFECPVFECPVFECADFGTTVFGSEFFGSPHCGVTVSGSTVSGSEGLGKAVWGVPGSGSAVLGYGIDTGTDLLRCSGGGGAGSSLRRAGCGDGGSSASATHDTGATGTERPSRRNNWSTGSAEPAERAQRDVRAGVSVLSLLASSATVSGTRSAILDARGWAVTLCTGASPVRWMGTRLFYLTRWSRARHPNMNSK